MREPGRRDQATINATDGGHFMADKTKESAKTQMPDYTMRFFSLTYKFKNQKKISCYIENYFKIKSHQVKKILIIYAAENQTLLPGACAF